MQCRLESRPPGHLRAEWLPSQVAQSKAAKWWVRINLLLQGLGWGGDGNGPYFCLSASSAPHPSIPGEKGRQKKRTFKLFPPKPHLVVALLWFHCVWNIPEGPRSKEGTRAKISRAAALAHRKIFFEHQIVASAFIRECHTSSTKIVNTFMARACIYASFDTPTPTSTLV